MKILSDVSKAFNPQLSALNELAEFFDAQSSELKSKWQKYPWIIWSDGPMHRAAKLGISSLRS